MTNDVLRLFADAGPRGAAGRGAIVYAITLLSCAAHSLAQASDPAGPSERDYAAGRLLLDAASSWSSSRIG